MHGVFDVPLSVPGAMDSTATYMLAMRTGRESGGGKSRNPYFDVTSSDVFEPHSILTVTCNLR